MEDVISYEVHVQDFTDRLPVDENLKGTLPAMHLPGLKNSKGEKIGFDYLVDLGINTVHLMPVQEFLHFPDSEWQAAFKDDPYMKEQGVNMENYDWGYRTSHSFAIETRFRKKDTEIGAQRNQFRDLIQAFHDKGIAVIVDFVFNHTAEDMDGRQYLFAFNALDKQYYYRTKNLQHIGEYGNETKSENRPMVQRWIIDQCKHFMDEFGVDGFRIDLAGQTDQQTLKKLRQALGSDVIIYGEPWIGSNDPNYEANPDWDWYKEDAPITFFQDDARNAFKGPVSNPVNKDTDRGYAGGNASLRPLVMKGLTCTFPEEKSPLSGINYLDIHDNWALADQFATNNWDGRFGVDERNFKLAAVLLYTSLGPIVLHGGTELMRSKGLAPLKEIVKESATGKLYFHGKRDTYNLRFANQFIWENVGKTKKEKDTYCDYKNMLAFWKGLNRFRLSEIGKVFRTPNAVPKDYYQFITPDNLSQLGYIVDGRVLVLMNTGTQAASFSSINLPKGEWRLIGNINEIDHTRTIKDKDNLLEGGKSHSISLEPTSVKIWVRAR
jgi:pullulanase/glycogen debranching enzyme